MNLSKEVRTSLTLLLHLRVEPADLISVTFHVFLFMTGDQGTHLN